MPKAQEIKHSYRNIVLKAKEDFDAGGKLTGHYQILDADGSLAVAHSTLVTQGRIQKLESTWRF